jgi:phosphatidate cytidylyltransferase
MSTQDKFIYLIGGIAILLFSASLLGWILKRRMTGESSRAVIENLNSRVRAWWVMVAIFAVSFLLGKIATIVLFALVSFFALREFLSLTPTRPGDHRALSISFFVVLPVQYWLIGTEWYGLFAIFIPVYAFLLLPSFSVLTPDVEDFLERSAKIQWGVMLAVYCISHVPALLLLDIPGFEGGNALLLFYLLLVVQMSDVLQYVSGKLFGKRKIAPLVSPGKTVEGFVGGALGAIGIGTAMWWITPFSPLQAAGMSAVAVLMGFLGGLVLSAVKRSLGAKDWGTMIQGHGGMMDRMDSICFAAPIFFHFTRNWFVP